MDIWEFLKEIGASVITQTQSQTQGSTDSVTSTNKDSKKEKEIKEITTMSSNPIGVPGAGDVTFDPKVVASIALQNAQLEAQILNDRNAAIYATAAENWTAWGIKCRDAGVPIPPKPYPAQRLNITANADGWPVAQFGPELVAEVVADIPPKPTPPPPGNVHIGVQNGNTIFYQAFPDDTVPDGQVVVVDGVYYKKFVTPWGGHYERLN